MLKNGMCLDLSPINEPFGFHFANPHYEKFNIAISIPYCDDININAKHEKDEDYRKYKNYAYYCISRSLDVLKKDGYLIFALPSSVVLNPAYEKERSKVVEKSKVVSSETYQDFTIIVLKKK